MVSRSSIKTEFEAQAIKLCFFIKPVLFRVLQNITHSAVDQAKFNLLIQSAISTLNTGCRLTHTYIGLGYISDFFIHQVAKSYVTPELLTQSLDKINLTITMNFISRYFATKRQAENNIFYFLKAAASLFTQRIIEHQDIIGIRQLQQDDRVVRMLNELIIELQQDLFRFKAKPESLLDILKELPLPHETAKLYIGRLVKDQAFNLFSKQILQSLLLEHNQASIDQDSVGILPTLPLSLREYRVLENRQQLQISLSKLIVISKPTCIEGINSALEDADFSTLTDTFLSRFGINYLPLSIQRLFANRYITPEALQTITQRLAAKITENSVLGLMNGLTDTEIEQLFTLMEFYIGKSLSNKLGINYKSNQLTSLRAFFGMQKILSLFIQTLFDNRDTIIDDISQSISDWAVVRWITATYLKKTITKKAITQLIFTHMTTVNAGIDKTVSDYNLMLSRFNLGLSNIIKANSISAEDREWLCNCFDDLVYKANAYSQYLHSRLNTTERETKHHDSNDAGLQTERQRIFELHVGVLDIINSETDIKNIINTGKIDEYRSLQQRLISYQQILIYHVHKQQTALANSVFKLSWFQLLISFLITDKSAYIQTLKSTHKAKCNKREEFVDTANKLSLKAERTNEVLDIMHNNPSTPTNLKKVNTEISELGSLAQETLSKGNKSNLWFWRNQSLESCVRDIAVLTVSAVSC